MKILYLSQWFDPEPILKGHAFAAALAATHDEVEVLTGFPSYPLGTFHEGWSPEAFRSADEDGLRVHRVLSYPSRDDSVARRALTYLSFALMACLGVIRIRRHWDVVYVYHPPISAIVPALLAARLSGARLVVDVQDLWPETLRATSMVGGGRLYRLVGRLCDFLYRRADRVVVLSDGFRNTLVARGIPRSRVTVVRNWSRFDADGRSGAVAASGRSRLGGEGDDFEVLYAGAVGPAQGLEVVLDAAERVERRGRRIVFRILGEGIEKTRLEKAAKDRGIGNVEFLPGVDVGKALRRMRCADVLLIHLRADPLFDITIPSKVQDCLSLGRPIVAGVHGEARTLLEQSGAATLFDSGDGEGLAAAVLTVASMSIGDRHALGRRAREYYERELSLSRGIEETRRVLTRAVSEGAVSA